MNSIIEFFILLGLNFKVKVHRLWESLKVIQRYYCDPLYLKIDLYFLNLYLFRSPFRLSKNDQIQRGEKEIYNYGETDLTALDKIANECRLSSNDVVFELGCGRGRTCFWLHHFIGCRVIGIDVVPAFIQTANQVKEKFNLSGIEFRLEDFLQSDLKEATFIYLYGTCYSASFLRKLVRKLESLPQPLHVISVSYPLTDYQSHSTFKVIDRFSIPFQWGTADVYFQMKKRG